MFEYTEILNCHQTCQFEDSMSKLATRKENISKIYNIKWRKQMGTNFHDNKLNKA
jgi:hypothetical protein